MYSRRRGKSGSKSPVENKKPSWLRYDAKEVEALITKIAKTSKSPSHIGQYLRDVYGIPDVKLVCNKRINQILKEKELATNLPEDLLSLIKRGIQIRKHLEENKQDNTAKRGLTITESKIHRLIKYYKRTQILASDWKYQADKARLLLE